jgi:hypothetical protein
MAKATRIHNEAGKMPSNPSSLKSIRRSRTVDELNSAEFIELPAFPQSLSQFWLFTLYDKDELSDLSGEQKKALRKLLAEALKRLGLEMTEMKGGKNA